MPTPPADADPAIIDELTQAGTTIERTIQHLLEQGINPVAISSALLGGSMCLMAKTMGDEALIHILRNAEASIRAGELRRK